MIVDSRTIDESLAVWPTEKIKEEFEKARITDIRQYGTFEDQKLRPFTTLYYKFLYKIIYLIRETKDMSGVLGERGQHKLYGEVYRRLYSLYMYNNVFGKLIHCSDVDWPSMKAKIMEVFSEVLFIMERAMVTRLLLIKRLQTSKPLGQFDELCPDVRLLIAGNIMDDMVR